MTGLASATTSSFCPGTTFQTLRPMRRLAHQGTMGCRIPTAACDSARIRADLPGPWPARGRNPNIAAAVVIGIDRRTNASSRKLPKRQTVAGFT